MKWLWLFLGGGCGAALRFALAAWVDQRIGPPFPWGTFVVNVAGCFLVGVLATLADEAELIAPHARFFLVAGVLGGFTTFSTFGLETSRLIQEGTAAVAALNVIGSVVAGVLAVVLGSAIARNLS